MPTKTCFCATGLEDVTTYPKNEGDAHISTSPAVSRIAAFSMPTAQYATSIFNATTAAVAAHAATAICADAVVGAAIPPAFAAASICASIALILVNFPALSSAVAVACAFSAASWLTLPNWLRISSRKYQFLHDWVLAQCLKVIEGAILALHPLHSFDGSFVK